MSTTITLYGTFSTVTCCWENCDLTFAMPKDIDDQFRRDHVSFYCPRGHKQSYTCKSDLETKQDTINELARKLEYLEAEQEVTEQERDHFRKSRDSTKGALTKIKKRIASGVCPCCNRQFTNLARHMTGKHPNYVGAE